EIPAAAPAQNKIGPPAAGGTKSLEGMSLMIVDDDNDSRELLAQLLARLGARVRSAASGAEALDLLSSQAIVPDVLISDVGMPGIDGYTLLRRVHALPQTGLPNLPAIALTAYANVEDRQRALRAGYSRHLV